MAAHDWAALRARWMDALATDEDDETFNDRLPDLISDSELLCLRDLDPVYARKTGQAVTITPGSPDATLPADCWIPRRLVLRAGNVRTTLLQRQQSFLDEYSADPTVTGTPKYWAMPVEGALLLAPAPTPGFTLTVDYTYRPDTLSELNPSTWLATHYPDLLFSAGMVWLAGWSKNYGAGDDPKMAGYWQADYQKRLTAARAEEARKKGEPIFESASPTRPPNAGT